MVDHRKSAALGVDSRLILEIVHNRTGVGLMKKQLECSYLMEAEFHSQILGNRFHDDSHFEFDHNARKEQHPDLCTKSNL